MKKYNVAVVGATGNVGREILNLLDYRKFPIDKIFFSSSFPVGNQLLDLLVSNQ